MSTSRFYEAQPTCVLSSGICHGHLHAGELHERHPQHSDLTSVQKWVDSLVIPSFVNYGEKTCEKNSCEVGINLKMNHEDDKPVVDSVQTESKTQTHSSSSPSTTCTSATTFKTPTFETSHEEPVNLSDADCAASVNPTLAQDAKDVKKTDATVKEHGGHRTFKGLFKKGLKDLVKNSKTKVVVNGHVLSSSEIRKAEEQAGKLRPGNYWYDSKAGFWGVMGGPCLGIIPPLIEDLNYPMATDSSKGSTQVYVNGRELHTKDLEVLTDRGLTVSPGGFYEITFDGVVIDGLLGEEIQRLGRLAPTVEKRGKGFGMFEVNQ